MTVARTDYISARVEPKLKASAHRALQKVGMTTSDAINLFLHQVVLHQGLPFDVRIPNAETIKALKDMRDPRIRKSMEVSASTDEMFEKILGKRK